MILDRGRDLMHSNQRETNFIKVSPGTSDRFYGREQSPMLNWKRTIKRLITEESGQSSTEYILILFLAFMVFNKIKGPLLKIVNGLTGDVDRRATDAMRDE
jgi:hypothetical protein